MDHIKKARNLAKGPTSLRAKMADDNTAKSRRVQAQLHLSILVERETWKATKPVDAKLKTRIAQALMSVSEHARRLYDVIMNADGDVGLCMDKRGTLLSWDRVSRKFVPVLRSEPELSGVHGQSRNVSQIVYNEPSYLAVDNADISSQSAPDKN